VSITKPNTMIPSYTFNDTLKRFEPEEKKCSYCTQGHAQGCDSAYYAPIYKVESKTNIVIYRSVQYNKVLLGIPRCTSCAGIHKGTRVKTAVYVMAILVAITGLGYWLGDIGGAFAGFIIAGVAAGVGFITLESRLVEGNGILTLEDGARNNLIVKSFLTGGWSLTPPTA